MCGLGFDLDRYAAAALAASVHGGKHEREMVAFVKQHRAALDRMPTAFLSVSLGEAGVEDPARTEAQHADAAAAVKRQIDVFLAETGWKPERLAPVAGALLYRQYGVLLRFVMRLIARRSGASTDTSRDHVYTDWAALDHIADELSASIQR